MLYLRQKKEVVICAVENENSASDDEIQTCARIAPDSIPLIKRGFYA